MKFELDLLETIAYDVLDEVEYYQKAYHITKKRGENNGY